MKKGEHVWKEKSVYFRKCKDKRDVLCITRGNHPKINMVSLRKSNDIASASMSDIDRYYIIPRLKIYPLVQEASIPFFKYLSMELLLHLLEE